MMIVGVIIYGIDSAEPSNPFANEHLEFWLAHTFWTLLVVAGPSYILYKCFNSKTIIIFNIVLWLIINRFIYMLVAIHLL